MSLDFVTPASREFRLKSVGHALGIIVAAFVVANLAFLVAFSGVSALGYEIVPDSLSGDLLGATAQFSGFLLAVLAYLWYLDDPDLVRWQWPTLRHVALMVGGFIGLFAINAVAGVIVTSVGLESAQNRIVEAGNRNPELFLYMIPITVVLVATSEELIFRGVVQGWLRRAYGVVPGILVASALFGAIHLVAVVGSGATIYVAVAATLGLVLGALYEYTENIVVPIVVHGVWNTFLFGIQYLIASGAVDVPA